jgi:hypothetical protein
MHVAGSLTAVYGGVAHHRDVDLPVTCEPVGPGWECTGQNASNTETIYLSIFGDEMRVDSFGDGGAWFAICDPDCRVYAVRGDQIGGDVQPSTALVLQ